MTQLRALSPALLALALLTAGCPPEKSTQPAAAPASNTVEASALIVAFEQSNLSFERNGEIMPNAKAATWLRTKLRNRAEHVRNGDDFIVWVADHSSETKKPYAIVLADGTKTPSAEWFRARLKELRKK